MSREREVKPKTKRRRRERGPVSAPPSEKVISGGTEIPAPRASAPLLPRQLTRRRGNSDDPSALVEKGSEVRVLDGAFQGKTGVVQELDGRGGARVSFGLLAARVEVKDLIVISKAKGRPILGSSHRKPQPPS